jgi:hypothetical protein
LGTYFMRSSYEYLPGCSRSGGLEGFGATPQLRKQGALQLGEVMSRH